MATRDFVAIVDRYWGLAAFAMNGPGLGGQSMTFHLIIIIILAARNITWQHIIYGASNRHWSILMDHCGF